jgi:hypothetical protein
MSKKKEGRKEEKRKKKDYLDLGSVASPSFSSHDGAGLDPFQGYTGSPAKPCKTRVYDGSGARGLPCAREPCVAPARGKMRGVLYGILREGIWYAIAPVPSHVAVVLWPRAAQPDPLGVLHIVAFMTV